MGRTSEHPRADAVAFLRFYFCDEDREIAAPAAERALDAVIALLNGDDIRDEDVSAGFLTWRALGGADMP